MCSRSLSWDCCVACVSPSQSMSVWLWCDCSVISDCSLVSDVALFNSRFNRDSFLNNIDSFLRTMPDFRPQGIRDQLLPKCHVLYFPMQFVDVDQMNHRESGLVFTTAISYYTDFLSFTRCGSVAEWLGLWTCDQQVAGRFHRSNPDLPPVKYNPGQVVMLTHTCLCHQAV